jgi:hypothetical protein
MKKENKDLQNITQKTTIEQQESHRKPVVLWQVKQ